MKHVETISVADIARNLGLRPQTARARLRRAYAGDDESLPMPLEPWKFEAKDRRKVVRLVLGR